MVEGLLPELEKGPSTALRAVPLPYKSRGGIQGQASAFAGITPRLI
jgi:hypothetical protein